MRVQKAKRAKVRSVSIMYLLSYNEARICHEYKSSTSFALR